MLISICLDERATYAQARTSPPVLVLVLACALCPAQDQDFSKVQIIVTRVAGNVYMLQGGLGGNIGASVGEDGIVVVDDQYAPLAGKIQAALRSISDKPIRFIINTHYQVSRTAGQIIPCVGIKRDKG